MAIGAAIAGSLAAGVGSAVGGIAAQPEDIHPTTSFYNPMSDPTLAGLSLEAMIGMGLPPSMILEMASPINQIINQVNMSPLIEDRYKRPTIRALSNLASTGGTGTWDVNVDRALSLAGMNWNDLPALMEKETEWRSYTDEILAKTGASQEQIFDARLDTQRSIASLMGDVANQYGTVSSQPGAQVGSFMRNQEADVNRTYDKQLEDVMRMSNASGFNPGRAISDLEDSRASSLRNLQSTGTLQAEHIISLMQGSLMPAQQTAATASATRGGQGVSSTSVAGNQASAINQIQAQQNAQRAQALGAGIAGAGSAIGNTMLLLSRGPAAETPDLG